MKRWPDGNRYRDSGMMDISWPQNLNIWPQNIDYLFADKLTRLQEHMIEALIASSLWNYPSFKLVSISSSTSLSTPSPPPKPHPHPCLPYTGHFLVRLHHLTVTTTIFTSIIIPTISYFPMWVSEWVPPRVSIAYRDTKYSKYDEKDLHPHIRM